ncbi:hypothetical protein JIN77_11965 [Verrucomicrobiaceae bacterium R5-34]|nr:hypothetical protein [Verrucomicrobiaceae bacterium R5-34]
MSRNTLYASIALMLVVLIGSAGAYWGIKKFRQKQNQEFRFEGKLTVRQDGVEPDKFKEAILTDAVMTKAITEHDLVSRWGLSDEVAAKVKLTEKFSVKVEGREITVGFQDKDKSLAQAVLKSLMASLYEQAHGKQSGGGM